MIGDADPELLIADWLNERTGKKVWRDPGLPDNWNWTTPLGHLQRGQDAAGSQLSLDSVLLDLSWYAAKADTARSACTAAHVELVVNLPLTTFSNGVFVKSTQIVMAPCWLPDPQFRRGATYRVFLHGFVE